MPVCHAVMWERDYKRLHSTICTALQIIIICDAEICDFAHVRVAGSSQMKRENKTDFSACTEIKCYLFREQVDMVLSASHCGSTGG